MAGTQDMDKVHQVNLFMLKEIDRICRKYQIKYMLDSGTLLGAVRHKGFIPWDDDVDLAFTRPHFEAFMKVVERELPEGMKLLQPWEFQGGRVFYDFTPRIYYENSKIHQENEEVRYLEGKMNHLWLDLFVIDVLPSHKLFSALTILLHKIIYGLAMGHRFHLDYSNYNPFHKVFVGVCANLGKLVPMKLIFRLHQWMARKDRRSKSRLCYYSSYQPDYLYVTLKKEWCEEIVDLEFEDTKLMAPKHWDELLCQVYGNYRTLPPKEKRVPTHASTEIQILDDINVRKAHEWESK